MPLAFRPVLIAGAGLAIGFFAGQLYFKLPTTALEKPSSAPAIESAKLQTAAKVPPPQAVAPISPTESSVRTRIETVRWLNHHGTKYMSDPIIGDFFNPSLALDLGLTPLEIEQLNAIVRQTKTDLDALKLRAATGGVTEDGKKLVVTLPSLADESRPLYDNFLNSFKMILGADRFPLFNELCSESFDRSFDQFGLNPETYELTLQSSKTVNGAPVYFVKDSMTNPNEPRTIYWSDHEASRDQIMKTYPALARFFTSDLGQ